LLEPIAVAIHGQDARRLFIAKRLTGPWRFIMLFLVVLPFFTSFVARTYA
jgi:hypothetical protein